MRFATLLALMATFVLPAAAQTAQPLPVLQDWSDTSLIAVDDDWSGVPGFVGYRGDDILTATFGVDPQTVLADGSATPVDVNADETDPTTFNTGGLSEFEITNPVVAMQGSGTSDVPHLVLRINTTGFENIRVRYNLRDIDAGATAAIQPFALHYRVGTTGDYTNVPAGYTANAAGTTGGEATLVTSFDLLLPADANNQPSVDIRWLTLNVQGSDEMIGIDDIQVTGSTTVSTEGAPDASLALTVANPVAGVATVRVAAPTADVSLTLLDLTGRSVAVLPVAGGTATLDTRGLAPGVYALVAEASGERVTRLVSVVR